MTGVMSLWTGTPAFRIERGPLLIHTLACAYANQAFPHTEFVTDARGLEIADRLGWRYTNFTLGLDYAIPPGLAHIWALGKLISMERQEDPFLHIDNDFLITKPLSETVRNADLVAQSKDIIGFYRSRDMDRAIFLAGLPTHHVPYNAGVIGGRNVESLHSFSIEALSLANRFAGCDINGTTTSMIVEQYFFGVHARRNRLRVEELIPMNPTDQDCKRAGICHFVGATKRKDKWIALAEKKLASEFPDAHARFKAGYPDAEKRCSGGNYA